jgi:hypothetical protein
MTHATGACDRSCRPRPDLTRMRRSARALCFPDVNPRPPDDPDPGMNPEEIRPGNVLP